MSKPTVGRLAILLGLIAVTLLPFGGCTTSDVGADEPVLRVGVSPRFPPWVYKEGRRVTGLEVDFAEGLAQAMGRRLVLVERPFTDLIPALERGDIDIIMSGMAHTRPRQLRVDFSQPYVSINQLPVIHRRDVSELSTPAKVVNTQNRVGVLSNSRGSHFVEGRFSFAERVAFQDPHEAARALIDADVRLMVVDSPTAWWMASRYEDKGLVTVNLPMSEDFVCWAVAKGDEETLRAANQYLLDALDSGEYERLIDRWVPFLRADRRLRPAANPRGQ